MASPVDMAALHIPLQRPLSGEHPPPAPPPAPMRPPGAGPAIPRPPGARPPPSTPSPLFPPSPQAMAAPVLAPLRPPQAGMLPHPARFQPPPTGPPPGTRAPLLRMPPPDPGPAHQPRPPTAPTLNPGVQTEVWFEHKTADGRVYYSHPQTQRTTWERPGAAQIIPQQPPSAPMAGLRPPFPVPPMAGVGGAPQLVPTQVWSEHRNADGKLYYYNKVTRQSVWQKPKDFDLVMPLPAGFGMAPPPAAAIVRPGPMPRPVGMPRPLPVARPGPAGQRAPFHPPITASLLGPVPGSATTPAAVPSQTGPALATLPPPAAATLPPPGSAPLLPPGSATLPPPAPATLLPPGSATLPPPGLAVVPAAGQPPPGPTGVPVASQPPPGPTGVPAAGQLPPSPTVSAAGQLPPGTAGQPPPGQVTPGPATLPADAMESSDEGAPVSGGGEGVEEGGGAGEGVEPPPSAEAAPVEEQQLAAAAEDSPTPMDSTTQQPASLETTPTNQTPPTEAPPTEVPPPLQPHPYAPQPPMLAPMLPRPQPPLLGQPPPPPPPPPPVVREEPKGPRPVSSVSIKGTPWCLVHSSDGRLFFFDAISRVSVWSLPQELADNAQVEELMDEASGGKRKSSADAEGSPSSKRVKLDEEESEGEEEGAGLDLPEVVPMLDAGARPAEAAETQRRASELRAGKTTEERHALFQEMLLERGVSAFSTWDKELPKVVFDPRYLLLGPRERKTCFEDFTRSRAEEERKEKRTKLKEKREEFRKLLEDSRLTPRSTFSDFAVRYGRDDRFKSVEKMREREQLFTDYITDLKKASRHRDEALRQPAPSRTDQVKADFLALLTEHSSVHEDSHWRRVKVHLEKDPRYRAVETSQQREEWFAEHVKALANKVAGPAQSRQERIQASLKERERAVLLSRSAQEKEWGRERDQLRKSEATQHFKALLADMVRSTDASWHETRRLLRKDQRWSLAELLESADKERLFRDHVEALTERKRKAFRRLLEETPQISLTLPWKKARKLIKEDPRYKNYGDSDHRREAEYDVHLRDKMVDAKNNFRLLLKETKLITYKSREQLYAGGGRHREDIEGILKKDQRYLVLSCVEDERERILGDYVDDLAMKGPPPPPTATNPSERLRR